MKAWLITSEGIWLPAYTFVFADTELEALQIAQLLLEEWGCRGIHKSIEEIDMTPNTGRVIWNGDY